MFTRKRKAPENPVPVQSTSYEARRNDIISDVESLHEVAPQNRDALIARTFELYEKSREVVAPVIAGFADHVMREADGRKVVFAARDGLGAYTAATKLQEKFAYPGATPDQLSYAYLTRRVVFGAGHLAVQRHLEEMGVHPTDDVVLADIGMYGSFVPTMKEVLPNLDVQYLISVNSSIPGYAKDPSGSHDMASMSYIPGNKAVHFLEDTYSGPIQSPTNLVEDERGLLIPNTAHQGYSADIALRRKYALAAIGDYATGLTVAPNPIQDEAVTRLDNFLLDPTQYQHLMVPHE